jgi:RHS repeat-associated protein
VGIQFNFLDKPELINIVGKGTVKIVYSATGQKLQKIYLPNNQTKAKYTSYIAQFIYEETIDNATTLTPLLSTTPQLASISFEEGRIRIVEPTNTNNGFDAVSIVGSLGMPLPLANGNIGQGVFDYFIKDNLQNTRLIVTEETHFSMGTCTVEDSRSTIENSIFNNIINRTPTNLIPGQNIVGDGWQNPYIGNYVTKLCKTGNTVGSNVFLKVMAGDEVTAQTDYYYKNQVVNQPSTGLLGNVITSLAQAIAGSGIVGGLANGEANNIANQTTNTTIGNIAQPHANNNIGTAPKAYITILFFDERFNYIPPNATDGSTFFRAREADAGNHNPTPLTLQNIKAPKNGYAYIYVSNESNEPVYFDNLKIAHARSQLLEENHYYAYGLKIATLSSSKLGNILDGNLKNNYLYQGDFSEFDEDLGLNDFELRNYDPQIGRWLQQDPYDQFASPYVGMGNDPVNMVDEDGGFSAIGAVLGGFAGWSVGILSAKDGDFGDFMAKGFSGMALGALAGGFLNAGNLGTAVQVLGGVQTVAGALGSNSEVNAGNSTPIKGTGAGHGASAKNDYNDNNFENGGDEDRNEGEIASSTKDIGFWGIALRGVQMAYRIYRAVSVIKEITNKPVPFQILPATLPAVSTSVAPPITRPPIIRSKSIIPVAIPSVIKFEHGGGKNAQHKSQAAKEAAKKNYEKVKKELEEITRKPNKNKKDNKLYDKFKKALKHWKNKMDDNGENHSMTNK